MSPLAAAPGCLGPYRLERLLGQGSAGSVYLAEAPGDRAVALKVLPLQGAAEQHQRFEAEVRAARALAHPGIVAVLDAGVEHDLAWIAMEVAPGVPLERYTRPPRLLPEPLALWVAEQVARALAHAHAVGVIHRDVKPANVLVDLPARSVKVTDFGLARLADAAATRTGVLLGSPAYLAPEQLAGGPATAAGDVYALGATLFQLLAGRLPYEGRSMGELLREAAAGALPDLGALRPDLPPALVALVGAAIARRPLDRPPGAAALADALAVQRDALEHGAGGPKSRLPRL